MKIMYFDDYKLGVLKGDTVVDVSSAVRDIPHSGPHDLINGLIERFAEYRPRLEEALVICDRARRIVEHDQPRWPAVDRHDDLRVDGGAALPDEPLDVGESVLRQLAHEHDAADAHLASTDGGGDAQSRPRLKGVAGQHVQMAPLCLGDDRTTE